MTTFSNLYETWQAQSIIHKLPYVQISTPENVIFIIFRSKIDFPHFFLANSQAFEIKTISASTKFSSPQFKEFDFYI